MFREVLYLAFDPEKGCNIYQLYDSCFNATINSPCYSPSLSNSDDRLANTLTMFSIAKNYEFKNRNVALNLAYYYSWLSNFCGFYIDRAFIKKQFLLLDKIVRDANFMKKYFNNVCHYIACKRLLQL